MPNQTKESFLGKRGLLRLAVLVLLPMLAESLSLASPSTKHCNLHSTIDFSNHLESNSAPETTIYLSRRNLLQGTTAAMALMGLPRVSTAYTPDPDKLQESLYFISRVQEATVQQERFMKKLGGTQQLRTKLKLTLRLVDKNYKLLDQINYSSAYVTPADKLVEASEAGYEAVDALQSAIEFVKKDENWVKGIDEATDASAKERIAFLTDAMQTCREQLLVYTAYMPESKLRNARYRVENENIQNRDEFDGDEDAGVYNPVNLPWTPVLKATADYKGK